MSRSTSTADATSARILSAVNEISPELSARAAEMEEARRLPADLASKMAPTGVFQLLTPQRFGGEESSPRAFVEVVEALSVANASAGWCSMIASTTALSAAFMEPETAASIYDGPLVITGGVFAPMGKAVVEGDHYRVSGRWQWGSGSANCTWLSGGCTIWEDGEMKRLASGAPDLRMMLFPAEDAVLHDTWHVMGLKGTGSGDFEVQDILVPKQRSVSFISDQPREAGPLYKFPVFGLLALGVSAVALGNAKAAIDAFRELAVAKKRMGSSRALAERDSVQAIYASCVSSWRAARAYLFDEIDRAWAISQQVDRQIELEDRADLRLACTHMTRTSADVCRTLYDQAGGSALFESSDLQRRFRDAHAATQHIMTAPATYEAAAKVLFDLPTDTATF